MRHNSEKPLIRLWFILKSLLLPETGDFFLGACESISSTILAVKNWVLYSNKDNK